MAKGEEQAILESGGLASGELDAIRMRAEHATLGPWRCFIEGRDHESGDDFIRTGGGDIYLSGDVTIADQDFIASCRQDVPKLIAEVERLGRLADFLKERLAESGSKGAR